MLHVVRLITLAPCSVPLSLALYLLVRRGQVGLGDESYLSLQSPHPPAPVLILPAQHVDNVPTFERQLVVLVRLATPHPIVQVTVVREGAPGRGERWGRGGFPLLLLFLWGWWEVPSGRRGWGDNVSIIVQFFWRFCIVVDLSVVDGRSGRSRGHRSGRGFIDSRVIVDSLVIVYLFLWWWFWLEARNGRDGAGLQGGGDSGGAGGRG